MEISEFEYYILGHFKLLSDFNNIQGFSGQ